MGNKKAYDNLSDKYKNNETNPNLFKKGDDRTKEISRKGQEANRKKIKRRKEMREVFETLLDMKLSNETVKNIDKLKSLDEVKTANITTQEAMALSMIMTAMNGGRDGVAAFKAIQETMHDEKDSRTLNVNILNDLDLEDLKKLADIDEDLEEDIDENEE